MAAASYDGKDFLKIMGLYFLIGLFEMAWTV